MDGPDVSYQAIPNSTVTVVSGRPDVSVWHNNGSTLVIALRSDGRMELPPTCHGAQWAIQLPEQ